MRKKKKLRKKLCVRKKEEENFCICRNRTELNCCSGREKEGKEEEENNKADFCFDAIEKRRIFSSLGYFQV